MPDVREDSLSSLGHSLIKSSRRSLIPAVTLTQGADAYTYSSVQIYNQNISPCIPNDGASDYYDTNKISTSPVPLTTAQATTTGDTYSATITYTGTTETLQMYDVTAGGSSPGSSCFSQTWQHVNIPAMVNGTTAYIGFVGGINDSQSPGAVR